MSKKIMITFSLIMLVVVGCAGCVPGNSKKRNDIKSIQESVDKLEASIEANFDYATTPDLSNKNKDTYCVSGVIKDDYGSNSFVYLNHSGQIREIIYKTNISNEKSKEENVKVLNNLVKISSLSIISSGVDVVEHDFPSITQIPEELVNEFLSSSGKEDLYLSKEIDGMNTKFTYDVTNGNENEDSYAQIYFSWKEEQE